MAGKDIEIVVGAKDLATKVLDAVNASTNRLQAGVLKASVVMTGAFAAFQTFRGVSQIFLDQVDAVDKLVTESIKLGTTVNELEGFRFALESIANIDAGPADAMLVKLAKSIGDATLKGGAAAEPFETLKLDLKALADSSTTQAFETVMEALRGVVNENQQLALTMQLVGRAGADALPVIRGTAEAYGEGAGAAKRLGTELSALDIAQIQAADTALEEMQRSINGLIRSITVELSPALVAIADGMSGANDQAGFFVSRLKNLVEGAGFIGALASDMADLWTGKSWIGPDADKHGGAAFKYLDDLHFAKLAAEAGQAPGGKANTASLIKDQAAADAAEKIVAKKEAAELASIERIAEKQREEDVKRFDRYKQLNDQVTADIQKEKDAIREDRIKDAIAAIEDVREKDIERQRTRADALKQPLQAEQSRLLTRVTTRSSADMVAENTKLTNVLLKDVNKKLDEANRKEKADRELAITLVGP